MSLKNIKISTWLFFSSLVLIFICAQAIGVPVTPPRSDLELGFDEDAYERGGEYVAETVNILKGNVVEMATDFKFPSPHSMGLSFSRTYNSFAPNAANIGFGWFHTYAVKLVPEDGTEPCPDSSDPCLKIYDETNKRRYFSPQSDDINYTGAFQEKSRVQKNGDEYVWIRLDGRKYRFDADGKLTRIDDPAGNQLAVSYTGERINQVTDNSTGRTLTFNYDANGKIASIAGPITTAVPGGVWVSFTVDTNNDLASVQYADNSGYDYTYGSTGFPHNLIGKSDKLGHTISTWGYDTNRRCTSNFSRDGKGADTIEYVSASQVKVTDSYGIERVYTIDGFGDRNKVTSVDIPNAPYARTNAVSWDYNTSGNLIQVQYPNAQGPNGRIDKFANYDARGNPRSVTLAFDAGDEERIIAYEYHPRLNRPRTRTEASVLSPGNNKVTILDYDDPTDSNDTDEPNENPTNLLYRVIETGFTRNLSGAVVQYTYTTTFTYNAKGQILSVDGPASGTGDVTTFAYSGVGKNLTSITRPHVGATTFPASDYDPAGYPKKMTDVNGHIKTIAYDGRARINTIQHDSDPEKVFTYNDAGELAQTKDEDDVTYRYFYGASKGLLWKIKDFADNYIEHTYDNQGNLTKKEYARSSDEVVKKLGWSYQGGTHPYPGLLFKEINADDSFTKYEYWPLGVVKKITDPTGRIVTYDEYDLFGRVKKVTQDGTAETQYGYDAHGNLTSVVAANGVTTTYQFDDMGRMVRQISPDSGTMKYSHHPALNQVKQKHEADAEETVYAFDNLGRLIETNYPASGGLDAYTVSYSYDLPGSENGGIGRLSSITAPNGPLAFDYDGKGRLVQRKTTLNGLQYTLVRTFTYAGRLTGLTYPRSNRTVEFDRSTGCKCHVQDIKTTFDDVETVLADNMSYRPFSGPNIVDFGNGGNVTNRYNDNGRVIGANIGKPKERTFSYYPDGRLKKVDSFGAPWVNRTYGYDGLGRLESVTNAPFKDLAYVYDDAGNRVQALVDGSLHTSYTYAAGTDRLIESARGANTTTYTYNDRGNPTSRTTNAGTKSFVFNQANQLIRVHEGGSNVGLYRYNGLGQRIRKEVEETVTYYVYDFDGNLIQETAPDGTIRKEYIYWGDTRLAMAKPNGSIYYFHNDSLGTPEMMTDSSKTVVWQAIYEPFGEAAIFSSPGIVNNFRLPGQYFDQETGLHYNWHRYYDPTTGRYLTPDPIGLAGGINPYVYVENDPVNGVDPLGLAAGEKYWRGERENPAEALRRAGVDAIADINQTSIDYGVEYAGLLYRFPDGAYAYTKPYTRNQPGYSQPWDAYQEVPFSSGVEIVGTYHTHGRILSCTDDNFSNSDKDRSDQKAKERGNSNVLGGPSPSFHSFLGTPYHNINLYMAVPGETQRLRTETYLGGTDWIVGKY